MYYIVYMGNVWVTFIIDDFLCRTFYYYLVICVSYHDVLLHTEINEQNERMQMELGLLIFLLLHVCK